MTEQTSPSVTRTSDTRKRTRPPRGSRATKDPSIAHPQSKLTPQIAKQILDAVRVGNRLDTAAVAVGVSRDTLHTWLRKGRHAKSGAYFDLAFGVEQALADSEMRDLHVIDKAAPEQWQAAAWKLERRYPDAYGRKTRIEGQIDVRQVYADFSSLSSEGVSEPRLRELSACQTEFDVVRVVLGWVNPQPDDVPRQGRPALELVAGDGL